MQNLPTSNCDTFCKRNNGNTYMVRTMGGLFHRSLVTTLFITVVRCLSLSVSQDMSQIDVTGFQLSSNLWKKYNPDSRVISKGQSSFYKKEIVCHHTAENVTKVTRQS